MSWILFPYGLLVSNKPPTFVKIKQRNLKNTSILMNSWWDVIMMCITNNCDCYYPMQGSTTNLPWYLSKTRQSSSFSSFFSFWTFKRSVFLQHSNGIRALKRSNWWLWWWEKKGVQAMVYCWKGRNKDLWIFYKD